MQIGVRKMGLKSKIFFTWVGIELALLPLAIPATAGIVERIQQAFPPRVAAVQLGTETGVSRYVVVSSSPFAIKSEGLVGEMEIEVFVSGEINKMPFGQKAQAPGPLSQCASVTGAAPRIVYTADRKTSSKRGRALEQAVLVEVRYSKVSNPTLSFEAFNDSEDIDVPSAYACKQKMS